MAGFTKTALRIVVIGTVVGGTVVAVASIADPPRARAAARQLGSSISDHIDANISDPVALREQLRSLESQYPARIAEVRGDLGQLREQRQGLERDQVTSARVIELADNDLAKLDYGLDQAETGTIENVAFGNSAATRIVIVHRGERLSVDDAYARRNQVSATRNAYDNRINDITQDLVYLERQESQLVTLLQKLETEQTNFQTQLFDLDRQIDAIARNERMITVMEKRQKRLDHLSRYEADSLIQLQTRLDTLRSETEQRLAVLMSGSTVDDYEEVARQQLAREAVERGPDLRFRPAAPVVPTVEVHTDDAANHAESSPFLSHNDN